jgi:hypothetical protein
MNGLAAQKFSLTWESIDFEISSLSSVEDTVTAIAPIWQTQTGDCLDRLTGLVQDAFDLEGVSPGSWREAFEAALDQETLNVFSHGLSCWLCESGQFPGDPQIFIDAALNLQGFSGGIVLSKWLGWAMDCNRATVAQIASEGQLMQDCVDCSELDGVVLDCEDWQAEFEEWVFQFDFNITGENWNAVPTGFATTEYVADHGFSPLYEIGGAGNQSCIAIFSDLHACRIHQIDIGLESAYPNDGQLQINIFYPVSGGSTITQDFLGGADFFTSPVTGSLLTGHVAIQIVRTDGSCTDEMEPTPVIRYVTFYGRGENPFI